MSLTVETGAGVPNADSYNSLAELNTYHTGNIAWAGTDAAKEKAARDATRFMELKYKTRWDGRKFSQQQSLDWPRGFMEDAAGFPLATNIIPVCIKSCHAELAVRALTEDLIPDIDNPGNIASTSTTVGPITDSTSYVGGGQSPIKQYRVCDMLVREFLVGGFMQGTIGRS